MSPITKHRSKFKSRLGAALSLVVAAVSMGAIGLIAWRALPVRFVASSLPAQPVPPAALGTTELTNALSLAGITSANLAAAGVDAAGTSAVVSAARQFLSDNLASWRSVVAADSAATVALDQARQAIGKRVPTTEEAAQLVTLKQQKLAARAALQTAESALFTAAAALLSESSRATLATVHANRHRDLPLAYRTVARSEAQWRNLRDALSERRFRQHRQENVPDAVSTIISSADSDPPVSTALANLQVNAPAIDQAFAQALGGE